MATPVKSTGMHLVLDQVRLSQRYHNEREFVTAARLLNRAKNNLKRMNKWGDNSISARVEALLRVMIDKARDERSTVAKILAEDQRDERLAHSQFGAGA